MDASLYPKKTKARHCGFSLLPLFLLSLAASPTRNRGAATDWFSPQIIATGRENISGEIALSSISRDVFFSCARFSTVLFFLGRKMILHWGFYLEYLISAQPCKRFPAKSQKIRLWASYLLTFQVLFFLSEKGHYMKAPSIILLSSIIFEL